MDRTAASDRRQAGLPLFLRPPPAAFPAAHHAPPPRAARSLWQPADYKISETMQAYFANFLKTGNPNGAGLPDWPQYNAAGHYQRMRIDVESQAGPEPHRDHYLAIDSLSK